MNSQEFSDVLRLGTFQRSESALFSGRGAPVFALRARLAGGSEVSQTADALFGEDDLEAKTGCGFETSLSERCKTLHDQSVCVCVCVCVRVRVRAWVRMGGCSLSLAGALFVGWLQAKPTGKSPPTEIWRAPPILTHHKNPPTFFSPRPVWRS